MNLLSSFIPIHLPISETSMGLLEIVLIGLVSGTASGLLGIGGGFISTPLLISMGIPPSIAVATSAHQIVGASFSGTLARMKNKDYDLKVGAALALFGIIGSLVGFRIFRALQVSGNIDFAISLAYVAVLGSIGLLSLYGSIRTMIGSGVSGELMNCDTSAVKNLSWVSRIPPTMTMDHGNQQISVTVLLVIGCATGIISVIMGIGGGFIVVPLLMYLVRLPNKVAIGTSLIQILIVSLFIVVLHIATTNELDIVLGTILLIGAVSGAQVGSAISTKLSNGVVLNFTLSFVMIYVSITFLTRLISPGSMYEVKAQKYEAADRYETSGAA